MTDNDAAARLSEQWKCVRFSRLLFFPGLIGCAVFGLTACEDEPDTELERAGEEIEEAGEQVGDAVKEFDEEIREREVDEDLDRLGDGIQEAVTEAGRGLKEAGEEIGRTVEDVTEE